MKLKTRTIIVFKMVFLKKMLGQLFPFFFFLLHTERQVPFTTHIITPSKLTKPQVPIHNQLILSTLAFRFFFDFFLAFGGGPLFPCELSIKRCFLHFTQNFLTVLYWEGFLGYLAYSFARKESLPHFLHLREPLCIYSFLPFFLPSRSALSNT